MATDYYYYYFYYYCYYYYSHTYTTHTPSTHSVLCASDRGSALAAGNASTSSGMLLSLLCVAHVGNWGKH